MDRLAPLGVLLLLGTLFSGACASATQGRSRPSNPPSRSPNPESRIPGREPRVPSAGFSIIEASIDQMRLAMEQGRTTSRDIVSQSLVRIATYEDRLNGVITVNPRALD